MNPLDSLLAPYASETKTFLQGASVFDGENDPNAYLLLSGSVDIYTPGVGVARYLVGRSEAGDFLGEGVLSGHEAKTVSTEVASETVTARVVSPDALARMRAEAKDDYVALLQAVLDRTRERMSLANRELGLIHDIVRELSEHTDEGRKGLNALLSFLHKLLRCSAVALCEAHPDIPHLWTYTFDSRFARTRVLEKAGDEVRELSFSKLENRGQFRNIPAEHALYAVRLVQPESREITAAIIFARSTPFTPIETRTLDHFAPTFASILRTVNE